jgi:hypothetical protein
MNKKFIQRINEVEWTLKHMPNTADNVIRYKDIINTLRWVLRKE